MAYSLNFLYAPFLTYSHLIIGLSNFNSKQIEEVCEIAEIKPAVLQCESHPYLVQNKLINYCKEKGIVCKYFLSKNFSTIRVILT